MKIARIHKVKYRNGLCFLLLLGICGLFGCASNPVSSASQCQSNAVSSSQSGEIDALTQSNSQAIVNMKAMQTELTNRLGERRLKLNERYCFYFDGKYVIAGGSGALITQIDELNQYYPSCTIPQQIGAYSFNSAQMIAQDNPTFSTRAVLPSGMEEDSVSTMQLKADDVYTIQLDYGSDKQKLWIQAYPLKEARKYRSDEQEIEKIGTAYTLIKDNKKQIVFLRWENQHLCWELHGTDPLLDFAGLVKEGIRETLSISSKP